MKAQRKLFLPVVLFLCLLVFGSISAVSSAQELNRWTVDKSANVSQLTLAVGHQYIANFTIVVDLFPNRYGPAEFEFLDVYDTTQITPSNPKGYMATVKFSRDVLPKTFNYSAVIGPFNECGEYVFQNTAKICNGSTDTWLISVHVPCEVGCTLTPGYWKTHSMLGPAPYDDTWAMLEGGLGEDTIFFLSGQTWYEVLWTPPAKGNAYYILAHAFIAAKLNLLNGASSTPEVDAVLIDD